jgi:multidrug resistance efflux pump
VKTLLKILFVVALLGAAAWWYLWRPQNENGLVLAGSIEARTAEVGSLVGGRVEAVHVEEGDEVAAGQPLLTFEPDLADLEIAEQEARIAELRANLSRTKTGPREEEVRRARIDYEAAEIDRKRFESLWQSGVVGKRDYDAAEVRAAMALETLKEAERGGRREDVSAVGSALAREERRLATLKRRAAELVVTAPAAGVVEVFDLRPGDLVAANQPVATLLEAGQLWVRVYVPETKLGRVKVGTPVQVFVDTYPDRPFPGRVVQVSDQAEYNPRNVQTLDQRADQVFGVKVEIEPAPELKAGMAATVRLEGDAGERHP